MEEKSMQEIMDKGNRTFGSSNINSRNYFHFTFPPRYFLVHQRNQPKAMTLVILKTDCM